jgi:7-cyano-7-deazaguanine reductase
MDNNQNTVIEIAGKHLGKVGGEGYKSTYAPELLVAVPRYYNRESYRIKEGNLPFVGGDVWNAYEVSAITENGRPVNGMMKIYCPADSPAHVESKSIKLYLNSFNMTRLGSTAQECIS